MTRMKVIRLALVYALMDSATMIDKQHLLAALAVWDFWEESARFVFGNAVGDRVADEILRSLRVAGKDGLTRTQIRDLFKRNECTERIAVGLDQLVQSRLAVSEMRPSGGRPVEIWRAM